VNINVYFFAAASWNLDALDSDSKEDIIFLDKRPNSNKIFLERK
jgi:hypothetical protein